MQMTTQCQTSKHPTQRRPRRSARQTAPWKVLMGTVCLLQHAMPSQPAPPCVHVAALIAGSVTSADASETSDCEMEDVQDTPCDSHVPGEHEGRFSCCTCRDLQFQPCQCRARVSVAWLMGPPPHARRAILKHFQLAPVPAVRHSIAAPKRCPSRKLLPGIPKVTGACLCTCM
jgi:hypothetical protein